MLKGAIIAILGDTLDSPELWELRETYYLERMSDGEIYLTMDYSTGGNTGGDCLGGESSPYSETDIPTRFMALELFLETVCPQLPLADYRRFEEENVSEEYVSVNEYYGNSTDYTRHRVSVSSIADLLCKTNTGTIL